MRGELSSELGMFSNDEQSPAKSSTLGERRISVYESAWMAFHPFLASSVPHHFSDITRPNSQTQSGVTSANIYFFKFQRKTTLQEH